MRGLGERGVSSMFGLVLLGVMLLSAAGLLYAARNAAESARRYEDEVRLQLAAESAVERAALLFESGGTRRETNLETMPERMEKEELFREHPAEHITCSASAYREDQELVISATAWMETQGHRFEDVPEYQRARAHLRKKGDHYVFLGWIP